MSDYYDIGKPFTREDNWNKLIRNLNKFFEAPIEGCPPIEPLEEVESNHIWTRQDIQDVRDKLQEACPLNFKNPDDYYDLSKPWHTDIIDEIEDAMLWCNCGVQIINEEFLPWSVLCTECGYDWEPYGPTIGEVYGGQVVAPPNFINRRWEYGYVTGDNPRYDFSIWASGPVSCEGTIENEIGWSGNNAFNTPTRQIAMPVNFGYSPYCDGRWPCDASAQALFDGYQAVISQYDPEQIQFRLTAWAIEYKDCDGGG